MMDDITLKSINNIPTGVLYVGKTSPQVRKKILFYLALKGQTKIAAVFTFTFFKSKA